MGARGRTGRATAALLGAVLVAGVGACSTGEPDAEVTAPTFAAPSSAAPSPEPEPSPSDEPSEEPTQAAPPLPDAATEQTPEGAVAFTEWWFETLNYATATGDTEALRAAYEETCETCEAFSARVEDAYQSGGRIVGAQVEASADAPATVEEGGAALAVFTSAENGQVLDAGGDAVTELTAEEVALVVAVLWRTDGWTIGGMSA